jgi:hypothetical protein
MLKYDVAVKYINGLQVIFIGKIKSSPVARAALIK